MNKKLVIALLLVMIATAATLIVIPAATVHAAPYCGITWGSEAKVLSQYNSSPIT